MRLMRPLMRRYRRALLLGSVLAVAEVLVSLAQPWPLSRIVDNVLTPGGSNYGSQWYVAGAIGILMCLVASTALLDYWSTRVLAAAGLHLGNDLRATAFSHLQRLSLRFHGDRQVGDLSARVTGDADRTQDMVVQTLAVLLPNALLMVGMFVVMAMIDPWFTVLALVATPVLAFTVFRSTTELKRASRRARKADGAVAAAATESLGAVHLVQAFSLEHRQEEQFGELNASSMRAGLESVRLQARFSPIVDLAGALSTSIVLWFGAQRVISGRLSLGVLLVFLSYLGSLYKPIKAIAKLSTVTSKGAAAAERVFEVLATAPQIVERPGARHLPRSTGRVDFVGVQFAYDDVVVLDGIDLSVEPGERLALVGPTGAGKSTLVSLVPRLADPQRGHIAIDRIDVRDASVASVRAQVSMVLQDSLLLRGTLRDNVAAGRPGASATEVERAVRLALVDEFASRLPDGLDTMVGERGATLSGGQRQRVAIARAILRDTPILILDEPTSALDAETEEHIAAAFANLPTGRTTFVIAHRLSTVRSADRIAVLE
ncbi:MAG TPA: ABC transporter ATP-binding protein, partial [Ilumatobacteraceae bacterium]|nr:ABC transporter ATP-binding protein [Ilumatobacteraceae bacterium]